MTASEFWKRAEKQANGCWVWQGAQVGSGYKSRKGYGVLEFNGERISAHRLAFRLVHGTIPEGGHVLHRCDNPPCINPDHLFIGTAKDNLRDMAAKGRGRKAGDRPLATHCPKGHAYTPENTYHERDGSRRCRICQRAKCRAYYQERKEKP